MHAARYFVILLVLTSCGDSKITKSDLVREQVKLGSSTINLVKHGATTNTDILFLNVHENETTSIQAMDSFAKNIPINYLYLEHNGERRISFKHKGINHSVDPNRIFTKLGRRLTLEQEGEYSEQVDALVEKFSNRLLKKLDKVKFVVAMHNNTSDEYSINSYLPDGGEAQNTKLLYINPEMDPDDFIYTTDEAIYQKIVKHKINVILQDNTKFVDDGSLSVYCGLKKIKYVNIETENGHLKKQIELMKLIRSIVN